MSCPDYYLLVSGREFIDFANNELSAWLKPRVSHEVYHCIVSAMEHRFRCGNKAGEWSTDQSAEQFWLEQAVWTHVKSRTGPYFISDIMPVVLAMVDSERRKKDLKEANA